MVWGERNSVEGAWSRCKTSTLGARPSGSRVGKNTLKLTDKKGKTSEITAARFVVAVGGRPNRLQIPGGEHAVDSDDIFSLEKAPGRVLCVGAGYIALECGGFTAGLGYPTTCMVRSILLRGFDRECVGKIQTHLEHHGVSLQVGVTPTKIEKDPATGVLTVHGSDGSANQYFHRADRSPTNRGDAAAATRTFPEDESRRGRDADVPRRRVAPRPRRGSSAETSRAAAATWMVRGDESRRRGHPAAASVSVAGTTRSSSRRAARPTRRASASRRSPARLRTSSRPGKSRASTSSCRTRRTSTRSATSSTAGPS